jgi:hypothetical protein
VVHELYHIDPDAAGIRKLIRADGTDIADTPTGPTSTKRSRTWFTPISRHNPDPALYEFLQHDFNELTTRSAAWWDDVPELSVVSAALHEGGRDADRSERPRRARSSRRRSRCSIPPTISRCGSSSSRHRRAHPEGRAPARRNGRRLTPISRPHALRVPSLLMALRRGCASAGAVPAPFPARPRPPEPARLPTSSLARDTRPPVVGTAMSLRAPVPNGGSDPSGFDCSGFVPMSSPAGLYAAADGVGAVCARPGSEPDARRPGDLSSSARWLRAPPRRHRRSGDQFVHAPSSSGVVRVESLTRPYWISRFVGRGGPLARAGRPRRPRRPSPSRRSL